MLTTTQLQKQTYDTHQHPKYESHVVMFSKDAQEFMYSHL